MEFKSLYDKLVLDINTQLNEEKINFLQELTRQTNLVTPLFQKLMETIDGGKRIRGFLVLLGYYICGGKNHDQALKGAMAYEIFQSSILIHDDIIDLSQTRRGKKTIHFSLGNNHYGNSQAICLGDIGFFWSMKIVNSIALENEAKYKVTNSFLEAMIKTGVGEILDIETPNFTKINQSNIDEIHYFKTAVYTFIGPLKFGALMANASQSMVNSFEKIGKHLGLAFQIKDDIIGVFNDEQSIGKSNSSDIEENKMTHLYLFAIENANPIDLNELKNIYGKKNISTDELNKVRAIFTRSGALDYANHLISTHLENARKSMVESFISLEYQKILLSFSEYLTQMKP